MLKLLGDHFLFCSFLLIWKEAMERLLILIRRGHCILILIVQFINLLYETFYMSLDYKDFCIPFGFPWILWNCSRPDRIIPIAERFGMDPGAVLDNVKLISSLFTNTQSATLLNLIIILIEIVKDHICSCLHIWASIQPASWSSSKNGWRAFQAVGKLYQPLTLQRLTNKL